MLIIGLTGSIGMGKSTAAARFRENDIAVFDADAEVHRLYEAEAVPLIEAAFPGTTYDGKVDRSALAEKLLEKPSGFKRLEQIVHPLVRDGERTFLRDRHAAGASTAVLEIPLLFETGADQLVDVTVVVMASPQNQRQRVLERPGMTEEKLNAIRARQMDDADKRAKADFIVDTNGTIDETNQQIDDILTQLAGHGATAYQRHWA